jgi:hypothetical protein
MREIRANCPAILDQSNVRSCEVCYALSGCKFLLTVPVASKAALSLLVLLHHDCTVLNTPVSVSPVKYYPSFTSGDTKLIRRIFPRGHPERKKFKIFFGEISDFSRSFLRLMTDS